jgi:uncharacterized Ntn-hydrolase superfamily protein
MKLLRQGARAETMLDTVLADDPLRQSRQLLAIDSAGHTAVFTGESLPPYAGAVEADRYIVGGCGLSGEKMLRDCVKAFEEASGDLADRLLAALSAVARDDQTGSPPVSAVLRISKETPHPCLDLRVDAHGEPVRALAALLATWRTKNGPLVEGCSDDDSSNSDTTIL